MGYTAPMDDHPAHPPEPGSEAAEPSGTPDIPPALIGDYANFARISHMPGDFFLDFGQHLPEQNRVAMKRRIVMSPVNVKSLLRALDENVRRYEDHYGTIPNDPSR